MTSPTREGGSLTRPILPFHSLFAKICHNSQNNDQDMDHQEAPHAAQVFDGIRPLPKVVNTSLLGDADAGLAVPYFLDDEASAFMGDVPAGPLDASAVTLKRPPATASDPQSITISSDGKDTSTDSISALLLPTTSELETASALTPAAASTVRSADSPLLTSVDSAAAGDLIPSPGSSLATFRPSTGPEPASITTDSTLRQASNESPSHGVPGSIVAAIVLSILATLALWACVWFWFRRRLKNKKRARELEKRAEWLDPAYVARVRQEMMGLDPSKTSRTDGGEYANIRRSINELGTFTNIGVDEDMRWTNRGKMSGSLGHQPRSTLRPLPRIRTTDKGSPLPLPNRCRPTQDPSWDFPLHHNPSEGEWLSNSTLPRALTSSRHSSLSEEPDITALPAPYFDPRGSMRESQIGLALPLPRSLSASGPRGNLTGDGYEAFWRTDRSRSRRLSPGARQGLGIGANGDVRMPLQESDDPEAEESFLSGLSNETTRVGSESLSHGTGQKPPVSSKPRDSRSWSSETVGHAHPAQHQSRHLSPVSAPALLTVTHTQLVPFSREREEATHVSLPGRLGAGQRWKVFRGSREMKAGEVDGSGNEDVVKGMLRERLGLVKGLFGR